MRISLSSLRQIIREVALTELPVHSTLNLKPGMKLRYTGPDMERPAIVNVIGVQGGIVTVGDKRGRTSKISTKELANGEYEIVS